MFYKKMMWAAAIAGITLASCMPSQTPTRKKMPGYLDAGTFETAQPFKTREARMKEFSLATTNESLLFNGNMQHFTTVSLSDASYDALVLNLAEQNKPYAALLIDNWMKQGNSGVIIDLRKDVQKPASSVTYRLEQTNGFSLPVIFRWDAASSLRAESYMALMQSTPGLKAIRLDK